MADLDPTPAEAPPLSQFRLDGNGPLYRRIKQAIARPILAGSLAPGMRLPSEHAFMAWFGTSRMTVNRALSLLAEDGLIVRQRRAGSFVAQRIARHAVMEMRDIADEIAETGAAYSHEVLVQRVRPLSGALGRALGLPKRTPVLQILCLHHADGQPALLEDRVINLAAAPAAAEQRFDAVPPNRWLIRNVPWTHAEHAVRALNADKQEALLLGLKKRAACLAIDRVTWNGETAITQVSLLYPGERHRLVGRFTPGG